MATRPDARTMPPTKLGPSNFLLLEGVGEVVTGGATVELGFTVVVVVVDDDVGLGVVGVVGEGVGLCVVVGGVIGEIVVIFVVRVVGAFVVVVMLLVLVGGGVVGPGSGVIVVLLSDGPGPGGNLGTSGIGSVALLTSNGSSVACP